MKFLTQAPKSSCHSGLFSWCFILLLWYVEIHDLAVTRPGHLHHGNLKWKSSGCSKCRGIEWGYDGKQMKTLGSMGVMMGFEDQFHEPRSIRNHHEWSNSLLGQWSWLMPISVSESCVPFSSGQWIRNIKNRKCEPCYKPVSNPIFCFP